MKKLIARTSLLAVSIIALSACTRAADAVDTSTDTQADVVESAVTMVAGQADDANGSTFAMQSKSDAYKYAFVESLLYGSAKAANCARAFDQTCNTGVKTATYSDCAITARNFSLNGSVTLTYSSNSCLLGVGDYVTRTYDDTISGPRGGAIQTTSALRANYLGTQIGGGGKLTHTSATVWTMDLMGKHKIGTRNSRTLFDVSARTTTPIQVTNTLSRSGRTITAGAIEVSHNLAKFTATMTVNASQPLVWSSLCCHPISGSFDAVYTGSVTGSSTVTFNGCGTAQLSKDGTTRTLSLGYCE